MKKFIHVVIFIICACEINAQQVICQITGNNIHVKSEYVKPNITALTEDNSNISPNTQRIISTGFGDITLTFSNEFSEEEMGFNRISISNGNRLLLNIKQDDNWTYTFGGRSMTDFSQYTSDNYCIPIHMSYYQLLLILCGWPYGGEMPLLTIIAITPNDAKVIYNRNADIIELSKSPFEMTIQTNIVEYNADGTPMWNADIHRIYYENGKFLYK